MRSKKAKKSIIPDLGLIYSAAIWGSTFFIVKESLDHIDPIILVGYRFMLAALLMLPYLIKKKQDLSKGWKKGFILGSVLWILYISQTIGLKYTSASNSGFITGLFIVFIPIISFIAFKRKPSAYKLLDISIAVVGLWFLSGGLAQINIGDIITLLAALTYAIHVLLADKYVKEDADPFLLSFQQFLVIGSLSIAAGLLLKLDFFIHSADTTISLIFLTLFPTLSAFVIQLLAQKVTPPLKVALIFSLEPVFAAIFAWTLGNELFIPGRAFGGLLIVLAMILSEMPIEKMIKNAKHKQPA